SGPRQIQGLPFQVTPLVFEAEPMTIPIDQPAHRVVVAHRVMDSDIASGGLPGKLVAEYVFHLEGEPPVRVPIRERFEISPIPESIWFIPVLPFGAVSDNQHV